MIKTIEYTKNGYKPLIDFESWRVAILNSLKKMEFNDLKYLERHMETDEVFVLLQGKASLIHAGQGREPKKLEKIRMKKNIFYNVKKASWHTVLMGANTKILIVENKNTTKKNSEYRDLTNYQRNSIL